MELQLKPVFLLVTKSFLYVNLHSIKFDICIRELHGTVEIMLTVFRIVDQVNERSVVSCDHQFAVQALKDAGLDMRLRVSREVPITAHKVNDCFQCLLVALFVVINGICFNVLGLFYNELYMLLFNALC